MLSFPVIIFLFVFVDTTLKYTVSKCIMHVQVPGNVCTGVTFGVFLVFSTAVKMLRSMGVSAE